MIELGTCAPYLLMALDNENKITQPMSNMAPNVVSKLSKALLRHGNYFGADFLHVCTVRPVNDLRFRALFIKGTFILPTPQ